MFLILWGLFESKSVDLLISFLFLILSLVMVVLSGMVEKGLSVFAAPAVAFKGGLYLLGPLHGFKIKQIKIIILLQESIVLSEFIAIISFLSIFEDESILQKRSVLEGDLDNEHCI